MRLNAGVGSAANIALGMCVTLKDISSPQHASRHGRHLPIRQIKVRQVRAGGKGNTRRGKKKSGEVGLATRPRARTNETKRFLI